MAPKRILIIGAGVAGPAAAVFLKRQGHDVTLIERAPEFKTIGFAVTIWPNGHRMLAELGLDKELEAVGVTIPWIEIADAAGKVLKQISMDDVARFGEPMQVIERSALHTALIRKVQEVGIAPRLGTTVTNLIDDGSEVHASFLDGTDDSFDVVLAADGIHSDIREQLFGKNRFRYYGWSVRVFWIPPGVPMPKGIMVLSRERQALGIFPGKERGFVLLYEYNPKREAGPDRVFSLQDFLPYLRRHGWTNEHLRSLEEEGLQNHQFYDHLRYVLMGPWSKGRVVLMGDARHGFSPIIGMGSGMALEDAYVFADEFGKNDDLAAALRAYGKRRTERVNYVRNVGDLMEELYLPKTKWMRIFRNSMIRILPARTALMETENILKQPI